MEKKFLKIQKQFTNTWDQKQMKSNNEKNDGIGIIVKTKTFS